MEKNKRKEENEKCEVKNASNGMVWYGMVWYGMYIRFSISLLILLKIHVSMEKIHGYTLVANIRVLDVQYRKVRGVATPPLRRACYPKICIFF